jgi:hypothetical protein
MWNRLKPYYDQLGSVAIFIGVVLAAGRVYRFPFDDEITTLSAIKDISAHAGIARLWANRNEMNPTLSHLIFYAGSTIGLRTVSLRWISIGCTAGALAIWHWMTVDALGQSSLSISTRLLIALLFGLTPLAISQGDALRWYPPLMLPVAVAFLVYLRSSRLWFLSGIAFGLAADVGFIAIFPFLAALFHRYLVQRRFRWREDAEFLLLTAAFAVPGLISFLRVCAGYRAVESLHYTSGVLRRVLETSLGFFGGVTLGISQGWLVALAIIGTVYLSYCALSLATINPKLERLYIIIVINAGLAVLFTLGGFSEPRAYLFLSPMISALTSIGLVCAITSSPRAASTSYAALVVLAVAVVANLRSSSTPFKRNAAIPFAEVVDFVKTNEQGRTAVMTMDASTAYSLSAFPELCVAEYELYRRGWLEPACLTDDRIDTVVVIKGDPLDENETNWRDKVATLTRGRQPIALAHFGRDDDAHFKSRLTGVPLSSSLLDAAIYR